MDQNKQNKQKQLDLDYDDKLEDDADAFDIEKSVLITPTVPTVPTYPLELEDGNTITCTLDKMGMYLTPEACVKLSLELYLGFPSPAIKWYYLWAQDYLRLKGSINYSTTYQLWCLLRKEHMNYWSARYSMARRSGRSEVKIRALYTRMKTVHTCRTVCRIVLNQITGKEWKQYIVRFLKYREEGLQDVGDTELGQGGGRSGSITNLPRY